MENTNEIGGVPAVSTPGTEQADAPTFCPTPIVFDVKSAPVDERQQLQQQLLEQEYEKQRRRAERFGTEFRAPDATLILSQAQERPESGFATGIDLFSEEERKRRELRARKFNVPPSSTLSVLDSDTAPPPPAAVPGPDDYLEPRKDVPPHLPRRWDAIHMYGTDRMSTRDVMRLFAVYGPQSVEWLDDSSCNILFKDSHTVKRALVGLASPLPPRLCDGGDGDGGDDPKVEDNAPAAAEVAHEEKEDVKVETVIPDSRTIDEKLLGWWCAAPFQEGVRGLLLRVATESDVKPIIRKPSSYLWMQGSSRGGRGRRRMRRGGDTNEREQQGKELPFQAIPGHKRKGHGAFAYRGDVLMCEGDEDEEDQEDVGMKDVRARGRRGRRRRTGDVEMGAEPPDDLSNERFGLEESDLCVVDVEHLHGDHVVNQETDLLHEDGMVEQQEDRVEVVETISVEGDLHS